MIITNGTYCVYVHTNKINGKMYVGKTINGDHPTLRWRGGGFGYKNCPAFWNAIQKYGWDNFDHEVIASHLTKEEADKFEQLLIEKLNTMNNRYGYNLTSGGDGGKCLAEETKQKIGEKMKGRFAGEKNPNYGNHKLAGKNSPMYGRKASEETIRKMKKNLTPKYVWCFELNQLFHGAREAERITHIDDSDISKACKWTKSSAGKHPITGAELHWCFVEKDMVKSAESINLLIEELIVEWQECVNRFILSSKEKPKDIHYNKVNKRWISRITYKGKRIHLGSFKTREDAIQSRLNAEKDLYAHLIKPKTREDFSDLFKELSNQNVQQLAFTNI